MKLHGVCQLANIVQCALEKKLDGITDMSVLGIFKYESSLI